MRISLSPLSGPLASEGIDDAVNTLRAELEASSQQTHRALLHYELALLYEQVRDDHSAAKELLLAVNGDSGLREPLERLIALMERRRSYVNLGKLLDRLGRIAQSPEESVRAQLARGDYMVDHRTDLAGALAAYEQASQLLPNNSLVWLSLHYLAARQSDAKLVETALTRRIQLAHHKGYRDSLRLQLARFQAMRGRQDLARATVEAATSPHSPVLYPALLQLEQLVKGDEYSPRASLLEQQAEVLSRGLDDHEHARARGIPASHLSASRLIDITLRAVVNLEVAQAKESRVVEALDRAFRFAPSSRVLVRSLRRIGTPVLATQESPTFVDPTLGNPIAADRLLALVQSFDASGPEEVDASLWLDQAQVAHRHADAELFKQFVDHALRHCSNSVVARALQLEHYWTNQRFSDLAETYEQLASQLVEPSSRVSAYLLAAVGHVLAEEPKEKTSAALNAALLHGGKRLEPWHMMLAHLQDNTEWAQESLRRGVNAGGSFEIAARFFAVRQAVQTQDDAALETHLEALASDPQSQRLGLLLRAALPRVGADANTRVAALQTLATLLDGDARVGAQRFVAQKKARKRTLGDGARGSSRVARSGSLGSDDDTRVGSVAARSRRRRKRGPRTHRDGAHQPCPRDPAAVSRSRRHRRLPRQSF